MRKLIDYWHKELASYTRVSGLALAGREVRNTEEIETDSIPLLHFAALCMPPGVQLFSLQKGAGTEQLRACNLPIIDLASKLDEESGTFMDTAAVIKNLDLVITADTALGHLAGALGAPVWVALSFVPDWRGCCIARIPRGIRPCVCSGRPSEATGRGSFSAWQPR